MKRGPAVMAGLGSLYFGRAWMNMRFSPSIATMDI